MNAYTTRTEAIEREVIAPLGEHADQHDIDAIIDKVIAFDLWNHDYYCKVNAEEFWAIAKTHAL